MPEEAAIQSTALLFSLSRIKNLYCVEIGKFLMHCGEKKGGQRRTK